MREPGLIPCDRLARASGMTPTQLIIPEGGQHDRFSPGPVVDGLPTSPRVGFDPGVEPDEHIPPLRGYGHARVACWHPRRNGPPGVQPIQPGTSASPPGGPVI